MADLLQNAQSDFLEPLFDKGEWAVVWIKREEEDFSMEDQSMDRDVCDPGDYAKPLASRNMTVASDWVRASQDSGVGPEGCHSFVRIDPNIGNLFGNLPLSSAIQANHFPEQLQHRQVKNLSMPVWAMKVVNGASDGIGPSNDRSLTGFLEEQRAQLASGVSPDALFGKHPMVGALIDKDTFDRAPPLSKWAARMERSVMAGHTVHLTHYASMYHLWNVMRWMICPTPATYQAIAEWMRPTPYQLFKAHPIIFDFIAWPEMRDLCINRQDMHIDERWLAEMAESITCEMQGSPTEILQENPVTGELDLAPLAKVSAASCLFGNVDLANLVTRVWSTLWAAGPSGQGCASFSQTQICISVSAEKLV